MQFITVISLLFLAFCLVSSLLISVTLLRRSVLLKPDAATAAAADQSTIGLPPGTDAPDFEAIDLSGRTVTLQNYLGKKTLFTVISASCSGCRLLLPVYKKIAPPAKQAGIELVLVSDDKETKAREFLQEYDVDLPTIIAPAGTNRFVHDYALSTMPAYCLIDENGKVVAGGSNSPDAVDRYWQAITDVWLAQAAVQSA